VTCPKDIRTAGTTEAKVGNRFSHFSNRTPKYSIWGNDILQITWLFVFDAIIILPMGSSFSIFGITPTLSSCSSDNLHNKGSKSRFETKQNKNNFTDTRCSSSEKARSEQGIEKSRIGHSSSDNLSGKKKTPDQLELLRAHSMTEKSAILPLILNSACMKEPFQKTNTQEIESAHLLPEKTTSTPPHEQVEDCENTLEPGLTHLHQLKRMRSSPSKIKSFSERECKSKEMNNTESSASTLGTCALSNMLCNQNRAKETDLPIFDLGTGNEEGKKHECCIKVTPQFYPLYHGHELGTFHHSFPYCTLEPRLVAGSNFQNHMVAPLNEHGHHASNEVLLQMQHHMAPNGVYNPSLSYPSSNGARAVPVIYDELENSWLASSSTSAQMPSLWTTNHLNQAKGKNSIKRTSAKSLVDGVFNVVSRSSSKWKANEIQENQESSKESPISPPTKTTDKHGVAKNGSLLKRSLKSRAAHQARIASPPSENESLVDITNKPRGASHSGKSRSSLDSNEPTVGTVKIIQGFKVTMVDEENKVFIIDLVSPETCKLLRRLADDHCAQAEASGNVAGSWRTLYTYSKMDLPCCEVLDLMNISNNIMAKVISIVGEIFGDPSGAKKLHPRSWKEPHLLKYQAIEGFPLHTGICEHYDGKSDNCQRCDSCQTETN